MILSFETNVCLRHSPFIYASVCRLLTNRKSSSGLVCVTSKLLLTVCRRLSLSCRSPTWRTSNSGQSTLQSTCVRHTTSSLSTILRPGQRPRDLIDLFGFSESYRLHQVQVSLDKLFRKMPLKEHLGMLLHPTT